MAEEKKDISKSPKSETDSEEYKGLNKSQIAHIERMKKAEE